MIDFRRSQFLKSAAGPAGFLLDRPQVVFLGRSNVGKSSLINAICDNSKLMYVSKTPGRTTTLNYLDLDSKIYLVDAPGYGFASGPDGRFEKLMLDYFREIRRVFAVVLTDSRRPFTTDDLEVMKLLEQFNVKSVVVLTKSDKLNQKERAAALKRVKELFPEEDFIFASVKTRENLPVVKSLICRALSK